MMKYAEEQDDAFKEIINEAMKAADV